MCVCVIHAQVCVYVWECMAISDCYNWIWAISSDTVNLSMHTIHKSVWKNTHKHIRCMENWCVMVIHIQCIKSVFMQIYGIYIIFPCVDIYCMHMSSCLYMHVWILCKTVSERNIDVVSIFCINDNVLCDIFKEKKKELTYLEFLKTWRCRLLCSSFVINA